MEPLFLFDTLAREKRCFRPLREGEVTMYTCGPTVYDYPHVGNLRAYVFADTLRRTLEWDGYRVRHIMNITDVGHLVSDADEGEDKIELQAKRTRRSAWEIAEFFTSVFKEDLARMNIRSPHVWSKATEHIAEQIALVRALEAKGYTYRTSDGMYFDTSRFPAYGRLARFHTETDQLVARVEPNAEKRNPRDFALWKFSRPEEKRQMEWKSPWGTGFPGWHVECSAMAMKYGEETLDIHTGGVDHISVHHTNEIAQSEAMTGKPFVRYWLHSEHLMVEGEEMSKSKGNIFTLEELKNRGFQPLALRYLFLTAHYRSLLNFTWESLHAAKRALENLYDHLASWPEGGAPDGAFLRAFRAAVFDDLDTPKALALVWEIVKSDLSDEAKKATILACEPVLGLELDRAERMWEEVANVPDAVATLLRERAAARIAKQWDEADRIRALIEARGYVLEDRGETTRILKRVL